MISKRFDLVCPHEKRSGAVKTSVEQGGGSRGAEVSEACAVNKTFTKVSINGILKVENVIKGELCEFFFYIPHNFYHSIDSG